MTLAILGLCGALVPVVVTLLQMWLKKKNDPVQRKLDAKARVDEVLAAGDADTLNTRLDDKLRELASRESESDRQRPPR